MIPLKLQLKNFLSYGPDVQTIDFSSYPLICLSGKNGHGKSALLDAITWALWGQARKVSGSSKADQGLLRLGQTQMMVTLDFEFNNQLYRIRREFAQTYGKPYAALDFGLLDANESFIPLTDKTISATQAVIEQTLNLTFDSFSNSAFLRQGQANEFSKKSPKDRKEILATILGLNQYEAIKKLAMEKIREANSTIASRTTLQEKIEHELQNTATIIAQLMDITTQSTTLATQEAATTQERDALTKTQKQLIEDQKQYQVLAFHYEQLRKQEIEHLELLQRDMREWKSVHKKQLTFTDIAQLEADKQRLINEIKQHQQHLQKNLDLKEQYLKQKEQAQQLAHTLREKQAATLNQKKVQIERLIIEKKSLEHTIEESTKRSDLLKKEKTQCITQLTAMQITLKEKSATLNSHTIIEKQFERRKEYYQKFLEQGRWLTGELENLEQKKQLAHDDEDPSCPLCEQNLSAARKRFLKNKFVEQEQFLRHRLQRITNVVKQLKKILIDQHATLEDARKQLELLATLQIKSEEHTKNSEKLDAALQELNITTTTHNKQLIDTATLLVTEQTALALLIQQEHAAIEQNNEYQMMTAVLKSLELEAKGIAYNQLEHKKAVDTLQQIEQQLTEYTKLINEASLQTQRQKTISELCAQLKKIRAEKKELSATCATYQDLAVRQSTLEAQDATLTQTIKELAQRKEQLLQEKARLETQQKALVQLEKEHKEQQQMILALQNTIYDYQTIAAATGKDGIQALLIEDAIPEIEHEANYLLSRLTNNQSQVFFESLRDLKKGGTKETLDIKISDSAGIRPYELFSGGEAFRIDFALRIAISKLLARRAGTSLQTLIIDEGFGSQDEEGLALIMDALYKIQDDFAKIIIVSHLPSMKDQFPVHFFIDKGPSGSTVTVIEQG
ncbi:MAG: SMC family ATPase [Candidatus Dependentiae bacterium]|nr:SMC family ATPase [Candidatus Dependentiae bacterium]